MSDLNQRLIGSILIGLSIILVFILVFVKLQSDREGAFLCQIVENDPSLSMAQCPAHGSSTSWFVMAGFAVAIALLGVGLYLAFFHHMRKPERKADISKLDDEERRIYELLKQHEGSMYQSDIIKETDFSKVRTTRILDKLEGKHVIERKRRGMTNIIILK